MVRVPALLMNISALAAAAPAAARGSSGHSAPAADAPFFQFSSTRFYLRGAAVPASFKAPFPALELGGGAGAAAVAALVTPPASAQPSARSVWALQAGEGLLFAVEANGTVLPIAVQGVPPSFRAALAASTEDQVVLASGVASGTSACVAWLHCSKGAAGLACHAVATASLPPTTAAAAATSLVVNARTGTVYLGTAAGLFSGSPGATRLARLPLPAAGVAVSSLALRAGMLAVGTPLAVFRCAVPAGGTPMGKCDHQLVSAVIDDVPTALALVEASAGRNALYIGNNFSASVWEDREVHRISGAQGLPAANITVMLAEPAAAGALWLGHARGLSLRLPTPPAAGLAAPQPRGPWRYFGGDRYLPGERCRGRVGH
jgi:hypothetical protein